MCCHSFVSSVLIYLSMVKESSGSINLLFIILGAPQFTNCPTSPQCVSVPVTYQCSVDTSGGANSLLWRVLNTSNDSIGTSFFGAGLSPGSLGSIASQFNATLTSTAGPIISNITFIPTLSINNYTVECGAFAIGGGAFTPVIRTCPIVIEGRHYYMYKVYN